MKDEMDQYNLGISHYGFSAASLDTLGATEYTLVTICVDESGSVAGFQQNVEKCLGEIVAACQKSPRRDNLLIRVVGFGVNSDIREIHGFKLLDSINSSDYNNSLRADGMTPLYDTTMNALEAMQLYGDNLYDHDYTVNGILFVITDGVENHSKLRVRDIVMLQAAIAKSERLESLVSILVGVNITEPRVHAALDVFSRDAKFTQYIEIDNATAGKLAKLAAFVSKSISSQSNALGTGKASIPLTI